MSPSISNFYKCQQVNDYEKSHAPRFDFLVEDLRLNQLNNQVIVDVGAGYGPIFERLSKDKCNTFIGIDGAEIEVDFEYNRADLSYEPFSECLTSRGMKADSVFFFETLEHLTNPYHALIEIKKMLKLDGILYLSIPSHSVLHNTIYPSLLYPVDNFKQFLGQCAFEIVEHKFHNKSFAQEVFILKNKDWTFSKMLWEKPEHSSVSPDVAVNL